MRTSIIAACGLVLGILALLLLWGSVPEEPSFRDLLQKEREQPGQALATGKEASSNPQRLPLDRRAAPVTRKTKGEGKEKLEVHGSVRDVTGRPVVDVELRFERSRRGKFVYVADDPRAKSDAQGLFEMAVPSAWGRLVSDSNSYVTLLDERLRGSVPERDLVLIVAARVAYGGIVRDDTGRLLAQAMLRIETDRSLVRGLRPGVGRSQTPAWTAKTDDEGKFRFDSVGWTRGLRIEAVLAGYEPIDRELPMHSQAQLELIMPRILGDASAVRGRVQDEQGKGLRGVTLFLGKEIVMSDPEGRFVFPKGRSGDKILAASKGYLPATYELAATQEGVSPKPITIVLSGKPLTISGRVVDLRGRGVAMAHVFTHDGERVARGRNNRARFLEGIIGTQGDGMSSGRHQRTDEQGRFELSGLLPRSYLLYALDHKTMEVVSLGPIKAGSKDLVFTLGARRDTRRVAGRVVSLSGSPVQNVHMLVGRRHRLNGKEYWTPLVIERVPSTDKDGRFEFPALCVEGTYLFPSASRITADRFHLDKAVDLERLKIAVAVRCRFQILLESYPGEADSIRLADAGGKSLLLTISIGNSMRMGVNADLAKGKSEVIGSDERARTLILYKRGKEVRRVPIKLRPGPAQLIRL